MGTEAGEGEERRTHGGAPRSPDLAALCSDPFPDRWQVSSLPWPPLPHCKMGHVPDELWGGSAQHPPGSGKGER